MTNTEPCSGAAEKDNLCAGGTGRRLRWGSARKKREWVQRRSPHTHTHTHLSVGEVELGKEAEAGRRELGIEAAA